MNAINKSVMDILKMPDVKAAMRKSGADQMYGTPEQFRKVTLAALDRTAQVLKGNGAGSEGGPSACNRARGDTPAPARAGHNIPQFA